MKNRFTKIIFLMTIIMMLFAMPITIKADDSEISPITKTDCFGVSYTYNPA